MADIVAKLVRVNLRLNAAESEAFSRILERVGLDSKGYAPITDVVKEFIGLKPYKLITDNDRQVVAEAIERILAKKKNPGALKRTGTSGSAEIALDQNPPKVRGDPKRPRRKG